MKPVLAVTVGDCNGVGPEVALKCLARAPLHRYCTPVLVGPAEVFRWYARQLRLPIHFGHEEAGRATRHSVRVLEPPGGVIPSIVPGELSRGAGEAAAQAVEYGVKLIQKGDASALVTAPLSKHALHLAGRDFPGQTEMLQHLTASPSVAMMLVARRLTVGLVTIHLPLRRVAETLTPELIVEKCTVVYEALRDRWKVAEPRIAVLALNPHAGESGDLGSEERDKILPALEVLRGAGIWCEGPFPADAFFGRYQPGRYHAVIAMYHDQGLIPLKLTSKGKAVNYSAGLKITRTSPDHGTAFDIAGKGIADASSMYEAIALAAKLSRNGARLRKAT